jgi:cathepsin L
MFVFAALFHITCAFESYESFRLSFGRGEEGAEMYEQRQQIFERRKSEMLAHNARNLSWKLAINHMSDHTDSELQALLGYKPVGGRWTGESSFLQEDYDEIGENNDTSKLATDVDWRRTLKSSAWVRNQGPCGSCWAVAATGSVEMQAERQFGEAKRLSFHHFVDCVPNPKKCGGTGGCHGATGELAFEFAKINGLRPEATYSNTDGCSMRDPAAVYLSGFVRLPENKVHPLLHAVATKGAIVVSVDGSPMHSYGGGVFSGCQKDTIVNHAMLAVGYGHEPEFGKDYWLVRNSWTEHWGEKGHMRIERHMTPRSYCGTDSAPQKGVFCENAPASVEVCGMCGIESDSAYPLVKAAGFSAKSTKNLFARSRRSFGQSEMEPFAF